MKNKEMRLLTIIVLYNKNINELSLIKSLKDVSSKPMDIYIYDNSLKKQIVPELKGHNVYYFHDPSNSGVSKAYNKGSIKAYELNKNVVLLLDQDTDFRREYLDIYEKKYIRYGDKYIYAPVVCDKAEEKIFSPAFLNNYIGKAQEFHSFSNNQPLYSLQGKSLINSGLMIPLKIFEKIGLFHENIKLDFSDVYFIEKYKQYNQDIILVDVYLHHSLSGIEKKNYTQEYNRFRYFCCGAKLLSSALNVSLRWSVLRRLLRLILKYKTFSFLKVYWNYYMKGKQC